jgi:hypothetical protein
MTQGLVPQPDRSQKSILLAGKDEPLGKWLSHP